MPNRSILSLIGAIALAATLSAQTSRPRPQTTSKPTPQSPTPETVQASGILPPLPPDTVRLPLNYPGDSIEEVARLLKAAPKSEFETNQEYAARLGATRSTRTYSFWIDRPMERLYDAETETLHLSFVDTNCAYIDDRVDCRRPPLIIKVAETKTSTRVLQNGFGATRNALITERANHGIFLSSPPLQFAFQIAIPRADAKVLKDSVTLLVTVGPVLEGRQLVFEGSSIKLATFDAPLQTFDRYSYLDLPLIRTWIASRTTGQIFQKFDVTQ